METKTLAQAILDVMKDVSGVAKSMTVGSGTNSYKGVSDKDVRIMMRESMIKHGLSILPISVTPKIQVDRWDEVDTYSKVEGATKSKQSVFTEVTTRYLLLHISGESIEVAGYGHGVDTQDKGAGKATTYALKNTLLNMFLVPTGVDTEDTHSDDLPIPQRKTVDTSTGGAKPQWFNTKQLKECIAEGFGDTKESIKQWASDYGYTISKPMQEVIIKYLSSGEITEPNFGK